MAVVDMERQWQAALREYFPNVIVREEFFPVEDDLLFLGVYMLPDDASLRFFHFNLDMVPDLMERKKLPDCHLMPCTVSQTRDYHPSIYAQAQAERGQAAAVQPDKTPVRKKNVAQKSLAKSRASRSELRPAKANRTTNAKVLKSSTVSQPSKSTAHPKASR